MTHNKRILSGIGCGVLAGALWGLVFLAPELVRGFTPLQLSAGRYLAYGAIALVLVAPRWHRLTPLLGRTEWWALIWLSLLGNILYYVLLASAVQLGGMAMTSLVIGFLPVTVTLIGSRDRSAVPLRKLMPSVLLSAAGIICIGWETLGTADTAGDLALIGLLCAIGALISWTIYAVGNSRWLARLGHVSAHDWSLLTGVVTGAEALLLVIPAFVINSDGGHGAREWFNFWAVAAGVAIGASIIGNALWNRMSRLLPLTLVGQMILFETLFALLYGFLWEQRPPTLLEIVAIVLVTASVLACLSAHRPQETDTEQASPGQAAYFE